MLNICACWTLLICLAAGSRQPSLLAGAGRLVGHQHSTTAGTVHSKRVFACRQQASPAFFQELAAWDAAGAPRDPAVWQSVRGCLKLVTRAQLLEECPTTGLGVLLHLLLAQVQMELCCMRCCRLMPCSQAWGCPLLANMQLGLGLSI